MFKLNKNEKLDMKGLNEVINISKFLLKIVVIFVLVTLVSVSISIGVTTGLFRFILSIIVLCIPLFIGFFIAWLFEPLVSKLETKNIPRALGSAISYIIFLSVLFVVFSSFLPMLSTQISELAKTLPQNFEEVVVWCNGIFDQMGETFNYNFDAVKNDLFVQAEGVVKNLTEGLPNVVINFISAFASGIWNFVFGLMIGFYFLVGFPNFHKNLVAFLPNRMKDGTEELIKRIDKALRDFVSGTLMVTMLVFVASTIGFSIVGLKGALLFGLFCGITNIIPYIGPYIGGVPAIIVGFTANPTVGFFVLVVVVVVQFIESMFIQPLVMSKAMKLHPVTIVMGLLIMGHFFGVLGMIVATPLISGIKIIYTFTNEKIESKKRILHERNEKNENNF